ncbi:MAG TPA: amidohydrolase family protein [Candidatus Rubrimentiphilum sp.]|nr:amidohydrolase family protein [Candidatus Rubrimentiphilum sp.]
MSRDLALVGGTIYANPKDEPIHDGVVLIDGETIAAVGPRANLMIPEGAETLDCSGLTITAGFWNSHVHFFERKWADAASIPAPELANQLQDAFTRFGFTSVFDLSSLWENTRRLRERVESGEVAGPRIRSTGEGLVAPGVVPSEQVLNTMGVMKTPLPEITDAAQAAAAAKKLLAEGVDGVKVFAPFPDGAVEAVVAEAHAAGKPAFAHVNTGVDVLTAARARVDVIAHTTPRSGPWDEAILAAMKDAQVALTPTLSIWKHFLRHDRISAQEQTIDTAVGQLRAWLATGGTVLFGTDLGAVGYDPTDEYALIEEAGMTFNQIVTSLTTAPAERFGESKRLGRIAPGFQADLVAFRSLSDVQYTLRAGKVTYAA